MPDKRTPDRAGHRTQHRRAAAPAVTVVQAIPKSERSELAFRRTGHRGRRRRFSGLAGRALWPDGTVIAPLAWWRWRAVARSAARQSRRPWIPGIDGPVSTAQLCSLLAARTGCRRPGPGVARVRRPRARGSAGGASGIDHPDGRAGGGVSDGEFAALSGRSAAGPPGPTVLGRPPPRRWPRCVGCSHRPVVDRSVELPGNGAKPQKAGIELTPRETSTVAQVSSSMTVPA